MFLRFLTHVLKTQRASILTCENDVTLMNLWARWVGRARGRAYLLAVVAGGQLSGHGSGVKSVGQRGSEDSDHPPFPGPAC